ncbi:unnamed protein product, partial [Staurois parvus]
LRLRARDLFAPSGGSGAGRFRSEGPRPCRSIWGSGAAAPARGPEACRPARGPEACAPPGSPGARGPGACRPARGPGACRPARGPGCLSPAPGATVPAARLPDVPLPGVLPDV